MLCTEEQLQLLRVKSRTRGKQRLRKEQAVQQAIVSEVVEHVRLKCAEQAQLIERVYEMQSGLVQALPAKLERSERSAHRTQAALALHGVVLSYLCVGLAVALASAAFDGAFRAERI